MKISIPEQIVNSFPPEKILYNEPMSRHTSIGTGGDTAVLIIPESLEELCFLISELRMQKNFFVIGSGSGILVSDKGYKGIIIKTCNIRNCYTYGEYLTSYAGDRLCDIADIAAENGLSGMEWAAAYNGTLGSAIASNLKLNGTEIKELLYVVEVITKDGRLITLKATELNMRGGKSDILQKRYAVCRAILRLNKCEKEHVREANARIRISAEKKTGNRKQIIFPVFTTQKADVNIEKLLKDCKLLGHVEGMAQICEGNPNAIINNGGATSKEIYDLIYKAIFTVLEKKGVQLMHKIKLIGSF